MLMLPHPPRSVTSTLDLLDAAPGTINRILLVAIQEWSYFGGEIMFHGKEVRTGKKETHKGFADRVGEYWRYGTGNRLDGNDTDHPWSATFISYVMRKAGVSDRDFKRAAAHSRYIHRAIQNRINGVVGAAFVGWRLSEYRPKEGDLVCYSRAGAGMTYDKAKSRDAYKSHSDIVVYTRPGEIGVIGGNVDDSVTLKILKTTAGGYLADKKNEWFAILENRLPEW
jgi:hypothetical protein